MDRIVTNVGCERCPQGDRAEFYNGKEFLCYGCALVISALPHAKECWCDKCARAEPEPPEGD